VNRRPAQLPLAAQVQPRNAPVPHRRRRDASARSIASGISRSSDPGEFSPTEGSRLGTHAWSPDQHRDGVRFQPTAASWRGLDGRAQPRWPHHWRQPARWETDTRGCTRRS